MLPLLSYRPPRNVFFIIIFVNTCKSVRTEGWDRVALENVPLSPVSSAQPTISPLLNFGLWASGYQGLPLELAIRHENKNCLYGTLKGASTQLSRSSYHQKNRRRQIHHFSSGNNINNSRVVPCIFYFLSYAVLLWIVSVFQGASVDAGNSFDVRNIFYLQAAPSSCQK